MKLRLPPHIGWPLMIVGLLTLSISFCVVTVIAATSDGGAAVVEDYYARSTRWDEYAARRAASDALGWHAQVRVQAAEPASGLRPVVLTLTDADGAPVTGLTGTVSLQRTQDATPSAVLPLQPAAGTPGRYRMLAPVPTTGLWDVEIDASRGDDAYLNTVRVEVR